MKKSFVLSLVLALVLGLLVACGTTANGGSDNGSAADNSGKATAKLTIIDKDGAEFEYTLNFTDGTTMREALFESGLISEEEYGAYFIQDIDGHVADVENDGCTWMIQDKDGNDLGAGMDSVNVNDGGEYILQYYVVPNFDD